MLHQQTSTTARLDPTPPPRAPASRSGRTWVMPTAVAVVLAGVIAAGLRGGGADDVPQSPSVAVQDMPAEPKPNLTAPSVEQPAYLIIQGEIDRAPAGRVAVTPAVPATAPDTRRPAYLIIQDEIDRALAERDARRAEGG